MPLREEWSTALLTGRLADGGPRYAETPADLTTATGVAEPWNAATAALFILLVLWWAWRLRGRYRQFPLLTCGLPILLAGGIGGTLYHATRASRLFFLLDVIPISLLGVAGAVYAAIRLWGQRGWWYLPCVLLFYLTLNALLFRTLPASGSNVQWRVNLSYASLAAIILIPVALILVRTRFRHGGWVLAGLLSFAIAWFFRLVDQQMGLYLPMGSHWLWHSFGASATACVLEYFYHLEASAHASHPPAA
ncbi:MAG: hypothetical protein NZ703_06395 [Gemmataceae bacterium]|nr:hypothetical protein [Gemmataceae bacterium]MCS7270697.1 hypothetical protein [Gemmataceae bacterium]MDW8242183.1 hypothetical protein [Thermogemmata sp.]